MITTHDYYHVQGGCCASHTIVLLLLLRLLLLPLLEPLLLLLIRRRLLQLQLLLPDLDLMSLSHNLQVKKERNPSLDILGCSTLLMHLEQLLNANAEALHVAWS